MNKLILIFTVILLTTCSNRTTCSDNDIELADAAYDQFELAESRKILETSLLKKNLSDKQKCEALRRLALQDWKFFKDYGLAIKRLMQADTEGISKFDTWMLMNRIEREAENFDKSLDAALVARKYAESDNEIEQADIGYAKTAYVFSEKQLFDNQLVDKVLLDKTASILSRILETNAGMPEPSRLLLGISLLNNDGKNVVKAWQSYFHIQNIKDSYPYISEAAESLSRVCEKWKGNTLNKDEQEILIDALASSRFYEFIPAYVCKNKNESDYGQKTRDIIIYSEYLKEVKAVTDEYYRNIAIKEENEEAYIEWLDKKRKELWNSLSFSSRKPYHTDDFLRLTEKHFGARGFTGRTGNYNGYVLCLGHIVNQEEAVIEQYGYKPEFLYTQIDMMVSNGFSSWFWENKSIGGWATNDEVIRIREAYLNGPFIAWRSITDSSEREKNEEIIGEFMDSTNSDTTKQAEGLATKLRFDALEDLHEKLCLDQYQGKDLELAFLSAYEHYRLEASILAHEGRHSIERKYMPDEFRQWDSEQREFHAKLSQIIFATEPRLELADMITLTGNSGHAKANRRIINIAIEWIKNNKQIITGYSDDKSEFSQIHLLTVEQIRDCYKQADPMNK